MYKQAVLVAAIASWSFSAYGTEADLTVPDSEVDSLDRFADDEFESDERADPWYTVVKYETCVGGWPGSRTCDNEWTTERDVRPGSVSIEIVTQPEPGVSVQHYDAYRVDSRKVRYTATVNEGDVLNSGKHTSSFRITWEEYRGYPGEWDYCVAAAPCGNGQGDCDSNKECDQSKGLGCVHDIGGAFGLPENMDVCLKVGG